MVGLGGYLFSVIVFALANSVPLLTFARFIQGLGAAFLWISALTVVADIAGEDVRGTSYGLYTFAFFLGGVLGPITGGWLYDNFGQASPFYLNSVVLIITALLVTVLLKETLPKENLSYSKKK